MAKDKDKEKTKSSKASVSLPAKPAKTTAAPPPQANKEALPLEQAKWTTIQAKGSSSKQKKSEPTTKSKGSSSSKPTAARVAPPVPPVQPRRIASDKLRKLFPAFKYRTRTPECSIIITVPRCLVGTLIGPKGATIVSIKRRTGAMVDFNYEERQGTGPYCDLIITGQPDKVEVAEKLILQLKELMPTKRVGEFISELVIPAHKTWLLTQNKGQLLGQFNKDTGAFLTILHDEIPGMPGMKRLHIRGSAERVRRGKHFIQVHLGEIPAETLMPPLKKEGSDKGYAFVNPISGKLDLSINWANYYLGLRLVQQADFVVNVMKRTYAHLKEEDKPYNEYKKMLDLWRQAAITPM